MSEPERLQKLIAQAGIVSRRQSEGLIVQGRVTVNGARAKLGDKADPAVDDVRVDGTRLRLDDKRIYIVLNKPMGIVTTIRAQDQEKRRTVRDLVPIEGYLYPVGRLDADSEGLIILTNDGELAQKLTHPRYEHPKTYEVGLVGFVADDVFDIWRRGVVLDDGPTKPVDIKVLTRDKDMTWIRIEMREGRKRQIRRIATTFGHPVRTLIRTQLDTLTMGGLKTGDWRYLTESEITLLQKSAATTPRAGSTRPTVERRRRPRTAPTAGRNEGRSAGSGNKSRPTGTGRRRPAATSSTGRSTTRTRTGTKPAPRRPGTRGPAVRAVRRPTTRRTPAKSPAASRSTARSGVKPASRRPAARRRTPNRRHADHR